MQVFFRIINQILPVLFWVCLILGFEEPEVAILTVVTAIMHESGHLAFLKIKGIKRHYLRGVISGFRIRSSSFLTYKEETMLYLSGPIANICASAIFALFSGTTAELLYTLNIATAISNLLPVEGYDGYGALRSIFEMRGNEFALRVLEVISSGIIFTLCILSIYFIDRFGGGYWIFGIFFFSMLNQLSKWLKNVKSEY